MKVKVMKTAPDLQSLCSIAQTSPAYHEASLRAEEDIIKMAATNGLIVDGIDLLGPLTTLKAATINQQGTDRNSRAAQLLTYFNQAGQTGQWGRPTLEISANHDLIHLQSAVKQLIKSFFETTISKHPRSGQPHQPLTLSYSENRRIQRAFHRWEIYAQLFGYPQVLFEHFRGAVDLPPVKMQAELLLKHLPWHEVEEPNCLLGYAKSPWASILEKLAGKVKEDNRKLPDGFEAGTPFELDDLTGKTHSKLLK